MKIKPNGYLHTSHFQLKPHLWLCCGEWQCAQIYNCAPVFGGETREEAFQRWRSWSRGDRKLDETVIGVAPHWRGVGR